MIVMLLVALLLVDMQAVCASLSLPKAVKPKDLGLSRAQRVYGLADLALQSL